MDKETSSIPLHPAGLIPLTVVAGLAASGPIAGAALCRYGSRKLGWVLGFLSGLLGLVVIAVAVF